MKKTVKSVLLTLLIIITAVGALLPTTSVQAATEYISFKLTKDNIYKTGICEQGEEPTGDVVIPKTFEYKGKKYKVTAIAEGTFCDNKKITSVEIPDSVKKIGRISFLECKNLKSVKLPKKFDSIGDSAFAYCEALEEIYINAKTVGDYAFERCTKLEKITFGKNVKTIGNSAFQETAIKTINLGKNIEKIECGALADCDSLESIIIGENVTTLEQGINAFCDKIKTVTIKSTKLTAEKCGTMGGPNGDKYLPPITGIIASDDSVTIKMPKSKLEEYKKFVIDQNDKRFKFVAI